MGGGHVVTLRKLLLALVVEFDSYLIEILTKYLQIRQQILESKLLAESAY